MKKEVNKELIESSIKLQSKIADLVKEQQHQNKHLNSLLTLFETATKYIQENKETDPLIKEISKLTAQNKEIAKSLILIERSLREQSSFQLRPPHP